LPIFLFNIVGSLEFVLTPLGLHRFVIVYLLIVLLLVMALFILSRIVDGVDMVLGVRVLAHPAQ